MSLKNIVSRLEENKRLNENKQSNKDKENLDEANNSVKLRYTDYNGNNYIIRIDTSKGKVKAWTESNRYSVSLNTFYHNPDMSGSERSTHFLNKVLELAKKYTGQKLASKVARFTGVGDWEVVDSRRNENQDINVKDELKESDEEIIQGNKLDEASEQVMSVRFWKNRLVQKIEDQGIYDLQTGRYAELTAEFIENKVGELIDQGINRDPRELDKGLRELHDEALKSVIDEFKDNYLSRR